MCPGNSLSPSNEEGPIPLSGVRHGATITSTQVTVVLSGV